MPGPLIDMRVGNANFVAINGVSVGASFVLIGSTHGARQAPAVNSLLFQQFIDTGQAPDQVTIANSVGFYGGQVTLGLDHVRTDHNGNIEGHQKRSTRATLL